VSATDTKRRREYTRPSQRLSDQNVCSGGVTVVVWPVTEAPPESSSFARATICLRDSARADLPPPRHDRRRPDQAAAPRLIGLTMRSPLTLALSGMTALMLTGCAGGDDGGAPTTPQTTPASIGEVEARVRTLASKSQPVQSVICSAISDDLVFCAVTFPGPSCQLWDVDGDKTTALPTIDGASGSKTTKGVSCSQPP
jgi:hypothetical protein